MASTWASSMSATAPPISRRERPRLPRPARSSGNSRCDGGEWEIPMTDEPGIASVANLLAHAYAMENEAHERYLDLAEQLEVHHNDEVAALFRKMAKIEQLHVQKILERVGDMELPRLSPWEYRWPGAEAPETAGIGEAHYMMTPHHALGMALR